MQERVTENAANSAFMQSEQKNIKKWLIYEKNVNKKVDKIIIESYYNACKK